jgi:DNA repair exonuclease SbcCD ATPase subunit
LINFNQDKQDIVEYLTIKVNENEKAINSWEAKYHQLVQDKRLSEAKLSNDNEMCKKQLNSDLDNLQVQCIKYKSKLDELEHFANNKSEIEKQVSEYKTLLEKKEVEYRETIHGLERKVLQDKNRMKREMLQKLNEAVANFRKVADQQMAETTKRAIRENLTITAQLNRMSIKVTELISENNQLSQKLTQLKTNNGLLVESEKELVKRNYANQKLVKTLIDKLQGMFFLIAR